MARPFLQDLNEAQRRAVLVDAPRLLILAGAGSGKTRTLTTRVARLVADGVPPDRILLCTFTRRAAAMMVGRLQTLLGPRATAIRAGTFHGLAYRALVAAGIRPALLDEDDQEGLMAQARAAADVVVPLTDRALLGLHSGAINRGTSLAEVILLSAPEWARHDAAIAAILEAYQAEKRRRGLFDYDDLLLAWRAMVLADQQPYSLGHVLIDEYQDTNPLQVELAEALAQRGSTLAVVGDDAQSIFGFRGARYDQILDFPRRAPTQVVALTINYRSDPAILAVANHSIALNPAQFPKVLTSERRSRALPAVVPAKDATIEAQFVTQRALELVADGLPLSEQVVLFRAHTHAAALELELTRRGVPYVVRAGLRLFEQAHVRDLLAHLRVLADPSDGLAWTRVLRLVPGVGAKTSAALLSDLERSDRPETQPLLWPHRPEVKGRARAGLTALADLYRPWLAAPPHPRQVIATLLSPQDPLGLVAHLLAQGDGARRHRELLALTELVEPDQDLRGFVADLLLDQEVGGRASASEAPIDRLTLSTVHQAKGLEWRAVFVLGLAEGLFPSRTALLEPGGEAEERRLFYVAVTRAIEQLYLCHPATRTSGPETLLLSPSRFLTELPPNLYERWALTPT